jgi:KDO2-lipid IV(A) lauroyltransferase
MQRFFNSSFGVNLGLTLGRLLPSNIGYDLASIGARILATRKNSSIVKAVRNNQQVVHYGKLNLEGLDRAVEEVFIHAGRCFVDLYHQLKSPLGLKDLSPLNPRLENLIIQSHSDTQGAFVVAPHLSNFDLVLLAAAYRGLKAQVLTYGNPTGGYQIQNDIRAQTGLDITPVSLEVHQQAIENMRNGGLVITAIDRPIRKKAHLMKFFGQPSPLPAGHIRMALEAAVPIIVVAAQMQNDLKYHLLVSDPIELQRHSDPKEEIRINGEAVLRVVESLIQQAPTQWLMYYPAWPDTLRTKEV